MSPFSQQQDLIWTSAPPPAFGWRHWPARENGLAAVLLTLALTAVALLVRWVTGRWHLASLAGILLLAALWRFYLPIRYELNDNGVHRWVLGRHHAIPWDAIRGYEVGRAGVLLLPFEGHCLLDALRGLYLPWGPHRGEILARIRYYLDRETIT